MSDSKPKPFLKWAGGKTQLLPELLKHVPTFDTYYEPFVGAGALFFELQPRKVVIADINEELINCYRVITSQPQELMSVIDSFPITKDFFHELRVADRTYDYLDATDVWRAARIIYLNKTCYNGLYRVNLKGEVNSPWGYYDNPTIYESDNIVAISKYLSNNDVALIPQKFEKFFATTEFSSSDFIYCDPPYDTLSPTSDFTGYSAGGFSRDQQIELKLKVDALTKNGAKCLVSNADTDFIRDLWRDYEIVTVQAKRSINSKADKRGAINEVLIRNY